MSTFDNALGLVEAAQTDTTTTVDTTPVTETPATTDNETPVLEESGKEETTEQTEGEQDKETPEGEPKEDAEKESAKTPPTPDQVRKALKSLRDNTQDAKVIAALKAAHSGFERWEAARAVFPSVTSMKEAATFLQEHGGVENLGQTIQSIKATDELLYNSATDPASATELWKTVIEDLRSEGKLEALPNLASALLSQLEEHAGAESFAQIALPVIARGLTESGATKALNTAWAQLSQGDVEGAKATLKGLGQWMSEVLGHQDKNEEKQLTKLQQERATWEAAKAKEGQTEIGRASMKHTTDILAQDLKPLLQNPYIKALGRPALQSLASAILARCYDSMSKDGDFQKQMKALWGAKTPDRAKILELTQTKVTAIAKTGLVKQVTEELYPESKKSMSAAAGRIAGKAAKQAATAAAAGGHDGKTPETAKFLAVKPQAANMDSSVKDFELHLIRGRAKLKGSGTWVFWKR